jgi:hypothetical protein
MYCITPAVARRGGVVLWYRLRVPQRKLELWVVRSNPARMYCDSYRNTFITPHSLSITLHPRQLGIETNDNFLCLKVLYRKTA